MLPSSVEVVMCVTNEASQRWCVILDSCQSGFPFPFNQITHGLKQSCLPSFNFSKNRNTLVFRQYYLEIYCNVNFKKIL